MTGPVVVGLAADGEHRFSKVPTDRVRRDPTQPNLRQVHLIHAELLDEVNTLGFEVDPGSLGENVLTRGLDLLGLPRDTRLEIGGAVLRLTGLRNPCHQIDDARPGLLKQVVGRAPDGSIVRRCGVMAVVEQSGEIRTGDPIAVDLPAGEHQFLEPV